MDQNGTTPSSHFDLSSPSSSSYTREILSSELYKELTDIFGIVQMSFCLLGLATNIINIRVFVEQGVTKTTTNIGLFSLSVFDFVNCLSMVAPGVCFLMNLVHEMNPSLLTCYTFTTYAVSSGIVFYHCSNLTTVYLSIERSLCVLMPLKVKLILRPKVTVIILIVTFVFSFGVTMAYSMATYIVWRFVPAFNATVPFKAETPFAKGYLKYGSTITNTGMASVCIFIVAITTTIMIHKLNTFRKWRQSNMATAVGGSGGVGKDTSSIENNANKEASTSTSASSEKKNNNKGGGFSSKDADMVKSVAAVTSIYLVCLSISHIPATMGLVVPSASVTGENKNLYFLGYQLRFMFSTINSSVNFFFYVRISSQYKAAFATVFHAPPYGLGGQQQHTH